MQAIVVHALGGPDVMALRTRPTPVPGPGEVLVRLHAVGVNFSDTERRRGVYDAPPLPWTPGNEAAGVVEGLGPGVDPAWLGRRVSFWAPRTTGTYAEYAAAPAAALFALRDDLSFSTGAALPAQGLTAYGLSHVATALAPGQTALVHAAAGGVGALLVQLLRRRGVRVFGTASTPVKQALASALGAVPLPYGPTLPDLIRQATGGDGVDAVFDSVGQATRAESFAALGRYGHLVYFGEASGPPAPIDLEELYGQCLKVSCFWLGADPPERWDTARRELQEWVADGTLRITLGPVFPLDQASEAHRQLESRETHGKLILVPPA
ncbi:MAG: zinc-binding dehydrogenase [Gemmatimonadales bacterium]